MLIVAKIKIQDFKVIICLRTEGFKLICKQLLIARTDRGLHICLKLERITSSKEEDLNEKKKKVG